MSTTVTLVDGTSVEVDENGLVTRQCQRCSGRGVINAYRYVESGVCFQCHGQEGRRSWREPLADVEKRAKRRVADRVRRERKAAKEREAFEAWKAERAEFVDELMKAGNDRPHGFLWDLAGRIMRSEILTERQEAAARATLAEIQNEAEEEKTEATPVPDGRMVVTGEIVSMRSDQNPYGYGRITKMLVLSDEGFKVWGTKPTGLEDVSRGDRVTFTAALQQSNDDPAFGFFSRPTKAAKEESNA